MRGFCPEIGSLFLLHSFSGCGILILSNVCSILFLIGGDHIKMKIQQNMSLMEKLTILSDAAKYDVACTSSGVDRSGNGIGLGNSISCGICHTFSADGRCVSLLKILFTNECIFNCSYCQNNCNSDVRRAAFTPEEVCELTMEFYRRNYIEGLF